MDRLMHWIQPFSPDLALLLIDCAESKPGHAVIMSTDLLRRNIPICMQLLTSITDHSKMPDSTMTL